MRRIIVGLVSLMIALVSVLPAFAAALGSNLVINPSMEYSANGITPSSWQSDKWGTNTSSFNYTTNAHTGSKSVQTTVTQYKNGDAKWYSAPISVKPSTSYTYSDWYQSNVQTGVDLVITTKSNTTKYVWLGNPAASSTWKQQSYTFTTPADAASVTIYHYIKKVGQLTIDDVGLAETNGTSGTPTTTPPTVSMSSPLNGATASGTIAVSATAGGATPITGVQFKLDGNNLGSPDTTAPYSVNWDTTTASNTSHSLTAVATNTDNLTTTSTPITITVNNTVTPPPATPPSVSISAPASSATVSGTTVVSAAVTVGSSSISNVQFKVDGNNLGNADTTAPYSVSWNTSSTSNGSHVLLAVVTDTSNLSATSTAVTVNVSNVVTPPTSGNNLIPNSSVETSSNNLPTGWENGSWGTNTRSLTYENIGHSGSRSLKTQITSYSKGDAKWFFTPVSITPGKTYQYSNYYMSNIDSEMDAMVTMNDGSVQWLWLGNVPASPGGWQKTSAVFNAPSGAKTVSIFQVLAAVGYVQTDDFSLTEYAPAQFNRGIVSLTFDDGWRSIYTNGLPLLNKYGFVSTQYLLTETIDYPDYMTVAMMQAFKDQGSEIASHTISHPHLTQLGSSQLTHELADSQTQLRQWFGTTGVADNFASPYGEYNSIVINEIKKYYRSHRSVETGYNSKDSFDIYNIKVQNITNTTTPADVKAWVDQAIADKTWLVIVYHEVDASPEDDTYAVTPTNLDQELNYIKQSGVSVQTVNSALNEIQSQL